MSEVKRNLEIKSVMLTDGFVVGNEYIQKVEIKLDPDLVLWVTREEYEQMGKPTVDDYLEVSIKVMK